MASLAMFQAGGFPVGGEVLGVDLADTIVLATDPPTDLLAGPGRLEEWWELQAERLPAGSGRPGTGPTLSLRATLRTVLDAAVDGAALPAAAVEALNTVAAGAPTSPALDPAAGLQSRWHGETPDAVALAVAAGSVIELLGGPRRDRLRRCANPACSMLFVATDARRRFCTQNICANRVRVARHRHRHQTEGR